MKAWAGFALQFGGAQSNFPSAAEHWRQVKPDDIAICLQIWVTSLTDEDGSRTVAGRLFSEDFAKGYISIQEAR